MIYDEFNDSYRVTKEFKPRLYMSREKREGLRAKKIRPFLIGGYVFLGLQIGAALSTGRGGNSLNQRTHSYVSTVSNKDNLPFALPRITPQFPTFIESPYNLPSRNNKNTYFTLESLAADRKHKSSIEN